MEAAGAEFDGVVVVEFGLGHRGRTGGAREVYRRRGSADIETEEAGEGGGLERIDDGAVQVVAMDGDGIDVGMAEVGAGELRAAEVAAGEVGGVDEGAGEVGILEVGFAKGAVAEFAGVEKSVGELGVVEVAGFEEDIAELDGGGAEAGEAAGVEFDADTVEAVGDGIGEIAVDEAGITEGERTDLSGGELDAFEDGAVGAQGAEAGFAEVMGLDEIVFGEEFVGRGREEDVRFGREVRRIAPERGKPLLFGKPH